MSDLEDIQAAFDTLSMFHGENWSHHYSINHGDACSSIQTDDGRVITDSVVPQYADLIVILHRTLDSQLSILDHGIIALNEIESLGDTYDWDDSDWIYRTTAIDVARQFSKAINGGKA